MADDPESQAQALARARRTALALCAAGLVLYALCRLMLPLRGLGNADIAGILYEADIINDGGLPFVDTVDIKSPGTFFLVAAVFRFLGRELWVLKLAYAAWALLAAPAIWIAARRLHGRGEVGVLATGGAVCLYLLSIGMFDFNYSAWMTPAYAWAFACLLLGLRGRAGMHALAGAFAGLAYLLKSQAVVLAPLFVTLWWWSRRRGEPGATWSAWAWWLVGAALAFAPLVGLYAARGALEPLVAALVPVEVAREYASRIQPKTSWPLVAAWKVPLQMWRAFPLQTLLALAAVVGFWRERRTGTEGQVATGMSGRTDEPIAPQLLLLGWSVVGCGLGGLRYYVHYLTQYLPALALLAAHPAAYRWLLRWPGEGARAWLRRAPALFILVSCIGQVAWHLYTIPRGRATRIDHRGNRNAGRAGLYIKQRTRADECIYVWGWSAWSAYYWSDRRACSPLFKALGQVTEYNQNSLITRSRSTDFKPGPAADRLLADLRARPPAFFVRTIPFFPGVRRDPLDQFTELRGLLDAEYLLRERFGRVLVYERLDHIPEKQRAAASKRKIEVPPLPPPRPGDEEVEDEASDSDED